MSDTFDNDPVDLDANAPAGAEADRTEQNHPVEKDPHDVTPRVTDDDIEVPVADAWEQSIPVGVEDDY